MSTFFSRLRGLRQRRRASREMDDELRFHLAMETDGNSEQGMTGTEARRVALRDLGGIDQAKETIRDVRATWFDTLWQDTWYAFRMMRKNPVFALTAVLTLMVGIGANTSIFSVINAVLLHPLPYPQPERLVFVVNTSPQGSGPGASPTKFNTWRQQTSVLQDVAAYRFGAINLTERDPEQIVSAHVSADFFRLFGAPVTIGRTFSPTEDLPAGGHVAVLSQGFWKRRYGGDPSVVGRTVSLNGELHEVVGVLGDFDTSTFASPTGPPEIWLPFQLDPHSTMHGHYFLAAGRLAPGATLTVANSQLQRAAEDFRLTFPNALNENAGFGVQPMQEIIVRNVRASLWVLLGAVGLVLLIACANVANLLLARATVRAREFAIRTATGAGRGRLIRQLLTESMILAILGGALGAWFGHIGIQALLAVNPGSVPRLGPQGAGIAIDGRVLAFTVLLTLMTCVLFGVIPAFQGSRIDLTTSMRRGDSARGGRFRQNKAHSLLVVGEIGLAHVLLVGSALFLRTFAALRAVDPGFDTHHVLTMGMSLRGERFANARTVATLMRNGTERLNAIPGVETAAAACCVPLQGGFGLPFIIEGRPLQGPSHGGGGFAPVSPSYFQTFRIPILRGRAFTDQDTTGALGVAIVNQTMAKRYWPTGDPLTDNLTIGRGLRSDMELVGRRIVGIVGDVRDGGLNRDPQPIMYVPWAQMPDAHSANLLDIAPLAWIVRTRGNPSAFSARVQEELRLVSSGIPVSQPRNMDEVVRRSTARSDFNTILLTAFAASALLLATIGVFGLMAYSVQQRTHEIGVRLSLGAPALTVRNMIVRQGMGVVLAGVAIGLPSAYALTRVIATSLFGVTEHDPLVFIGVPVLLAAAALLSVWVPARRAARVDPMRALRTE